MFDNQQTQKFNSKQSSTWDLANEILYPFKSLSLKKILLMHKFDKLALYCH